MTGNLKFYYPKWREADTHENFFEWLETGSGKDLDLEEVENMYTQVDGLIEFNPIQTQCFSKLYQSRESVFIGAPSGSGLLTCAELAIFRELNEEGDVKILYVAPNTLLCESVYANW